VTPRRIAHLLGLVALLAVVVPFVIYAVPGVIGAEHTFVVLSGSMEPELSPGDAVVVDETDPGDIEEGDVITFARSGSDTVVTHRVVGVGERNGRLVFETKGDANDDADRQPVPAGNVLGSVTLTIPMIGHVVQFANTSLGFATMVLLPLGLLAVTEAWSFARSVNAGSDGVGGSAAAVRDSVSRKSDRDDGDASAGGVVSPLEWSDDGAVASDGADADDGTNSGPGTTAGYGAEVDEQADTDGDQEDPVTVDVTDFDVTLGLLAAATPYTVHVALQLQTVTTLAVAYATAFATLALGTLRAMTWYQARDDRTEPERTPTPGAAEPTTGEGPDGRGGPQVPSEDRAAERAAPNLVEDRRDPGAQVVARMDEPAPAEGPAEPETAGGEEDRTNGGSTATDDGGDPTDGSPRTPEGVPSEPTPGPDGADDHGGVQPEEGDP